MRALVIILSMLITAPVWAGWEKMFDGEEGMSFYIDPATIKKNGDLETVHVLSDVTLADAQWKQKYPDGQRSWITLSEFDCKGSERWRQLAVFQYAERMAAGKIVNAYPQVGNWQEIAGATNRRRDIRRMVCK